MINGKPIKVSDECHTILRNIFAMYDMKTGKGGQGMGDIIEEAMCNYKPIIQFAKAHKLKLPKCDNVVNWRV